MTSGIPISEVVSIIMDEIPQMAKENIPKSVFWYYHEGGRRDRIQIQIELSNNEIKKKYKDASITVSRYCHIVNGADHTLKFSIFAGQCLVGKKLNKKAPDRTLELELVLPAKGKPSLSYQEIGKIETSLSNEVCSVWDKHVK